MSPYAIPISIFVYAKVHTHTLSVSILKEKIWNDLPKKEVPCRSILLDSVVMSLTNCS